MQFLEAFKRKHLRHVAHVGQSTEYLGWLYIKGQFIIYTYHYSFTFVLATTMVMFRILCCFISCTKIRPSSTPSQVVETGNKSPPSPPPQVAKMDKKKPPSPPSQMLKTEKKKPPPPRRAVKNTTDRRRCYANDVGGVGGGCGGG